MARLHFPTKEPFVDLKTGMLTDRWRNFLEELNLSLGGLDFSAIAGTLALTQLPSHQTTHQAGGTDAIKIDELAAPNDNTDLDVSTTAHGLCPKLSGNVGDKLRGDGTWGV
jgi:hypothetical protein